MTIHVTHCPRGHSYDEANTYRKPYFGWRQCKACNLASVKAYQRRLREGVAA